MKMNRKEPEINVDMKINYHDISMSYYNIIIKKESDGRYLIKDWLTSSLGDGTEWENETCDNFHCKNYEEVLKWLKEKIEEFYQEEITRKKNIIKNKDKEV